MLKDLGIILTIEDEENNVSANDLLNIVYEFKYAGAEAISINKERIVGTSDIFDVNGRILVNGTRIEGPYEIKAIGDISYLESSINSKGGYKDDLEADGKKVYYEKNENIQIEKYDGVMEINYGK